MDHGSQILNPTSPTPICDRPAPAHFVRIGEDAGGLLHSRHELLACFRQQGYALFELHSDPPQASRALSRLANSLGLGRPVVPPLYRAPATAHLYDEFGINLISAATPEGGLPAHPVFESCTEQELHVDGTLQETGELRTSLLYCVCQAPQGGATTLFRAADAFAALWARQPRLARPLLDERALERRATVNAPGAAKRGPVFEIDDRGEILSRYSTTPRDHWATDGPDRVEGLGGARDAMAELARPGSPFFCEIRLGPGQGILIANDKISHGRRGYSDSAHQVRRMLRALFRGRPSIASGRARGEDAG